MSNPDNNFDFAGAGFILLNLGHRDDQFRVSGQASGSQPLSNITFNSTTGATSFHVAESPTTGVRNINFSGNVINDNSGNAIGFTGTWEGTRLPIIPKSDARVHPTAIGVIPTPFEVKGLWAAVIDRNQI